MSKVYSKNIAIVEYVERAYVSFDALLVKSIDDAMILPYSNRGQYVDNHLISSVCDACADCGKQINKEVIYLGGFSTQHYGNFLIDYLSRLWYYNKDKKIDLVYVSKKLCIEKSTFYMHILNYLHIEKSQIQRITEPTFFQKYMFLKEV